MISAREREILMHASEGRTDKEIAKELGITPATVRTHWDRLRTKTGASNRPAIIMRILGSELKALANEAMEARRDRDILIEEAEGYAVFSISLEGKILDWNKGVFRVLGYSESEFVGADFGLVFTPEDARAGEPEHELAEAAAHGRCLERRYHMRKDGVHVFIDGTVVAIRDETGVIRRFSKIMRDDSQRKSMEEEIQRLQARTRK
jgi:PAS domain S-box-containing protein